MPTYEALARFFRDLEALSPEQRAAFRAVLPLFVADLRGGGFRRSLRVKRIRGLKKPQVYEMTWAADGRATWMYGPEQRPGERHVVWRRIGTHAVLDDA